MKQTLMLPRDWWQFVVYQAWEGLRRQYARTKLGPWWVVMTQFVMIGGMALVFSSVFKQSLTDYLPFISGSILTWNLISPTITQAPTTFVAGYSIIQSFRVPFSIFPIQQILNNLFVFLHGLIVHFWVMIYLGKPVALIPLAMVMVALLLAIVYPIVALIGILGARFRDIGPAVSSMMTMLFFITPIIWEANSLPSDRLWLATYNPFAHILEIVRSPLIGRWPPTESVLVCLFLAVLALAGGGMIYRRFARPLPFWV